jgi:hypothetical protein
MRRESGAGVKMIGMKVAVVAAAVVALAGCDPSTILVSVVNGCSASAQVLVSDSAHHADHVAKDFRQISPAASDVFIVPVGPNGDISLMTWDATNTKQVTRTVSLAKEAVDGVAPDGKALRVVTLTGADCPAAS